MLSKYNYFLPYFMLESYSDSEGRSLKQLIEFELANKDQTEKYLCHYQNQVV